MVRYPLYAQVNTKFNLPRFLKIPTKTIFHQVLRIKLKMHWKNSWFDYKKQQVNLRTTTQKLFEFHYKMNLSIQMRTLILQSTIV